MNSSRECRGLEVGPRLYVFIYDIKSINITFIEINDGAPKIHGPELAPPSVQISSASSVQFTSAAHSHELDSERARCLGDIELHLESFDEGSRRRAGRRCCAIGLTLGDLIRATNMRFVVDVSPSWRQSRESRQVPEAPQSVEADPRSRLPSPCHYCGNPPVVGRTTAFVVGMRTLELWRFAISSQKCA